MANGENHSVLRYFGNLSDPGRDNKRLKLIDIITIAICAVICNADSFVLRKTSQCSGILP